MCGPGLAYVPIITGLLLCMTFVTSYIIAVLRNDVSPGLPYISDTGTDVPESCIFGQLLNMVAFLGFITIYVRYKMIQDFNQNEDTKLKKMNKTGLILGFISSVGISLVANFQETSIEVMHIIGATMCFGCGLIYSAVQTVISYHMHPMYNGRIICRVRLVITAVCFVALTLAFTFTGISRYQLEHSKSIIDRFHWKPGEDGYTAHLISAIAEWVMAISYILFFFTYVRDFQKVDIDIKTRLYVRHLSEQPVYESFHTDRPIKQDQPVITDRTPLLTQQI